MSRSDAAMKFVNWVAASFLLLAIWSGSSLAQSPSKPSRTSDDPTPIASNRSGETSTANTAVAANLVRALPRLDGVPSPGLRVTLDGTSSSGGRVWYRWLQTQGSKVAIEDATRPEAHFTVPADASLLSFVLIVGNASGVDAKPLVVEVEDLERDADNDALKADAGDDQSSKIGRRVVLNGIRSEPARKIRFRWVQSGGPKVSIKGSEGATASFVPTASGTYQFTLLVASSTGLISDPSTVTVNVGGTSRGSADGPSMAIDELARVSMASIEGGSRYADDLSKSFDNVADGILSFRTFAEVISETTRRLDAVVPREKDRRAVWIDQLFAPLMAKFVAGLKDDGLDVTQPGAQAKPMSRDQKTHLAEQFRFAAAGLRAARSMR